MKLDDIFILPKDFSIEKIVGSINNFTFYSPKHNGKYVDFGGYSSQMTWLREDAIKACWYNNKWF